MHSCMRGLVFLGREQEPGQQEGMVRAAAGPAQFRGGAEPAGVGAGRPGRERHEPGTKSEPVSGDFSGAE